MWVPELLSYFLYHLLPMNWSANPTSDRLEGDKEKVSAITLQPLLWFLMFLHRGYSQISWFHKNSIL